MPDFRSDSFPDPEVREQLAKILASPMFINAARASRFLQFVTNRALDGAADEIKEYVIAVEVFGRKESYDSREHSAVRVEAARLRQRLQTYYDSHPEDRLVIDLPKGKYVPVFAVRETVAPPPVLPEPEINTATRHWLIPAAAILAVVVLAGAYLAFSRARGRDTQMPFRYRALTETPGQENAPSFSPSGNMVVYSKREGSNWHLFLEAIKNPNPRDLTADASTDNTQPVFSPDGTRIAFRSERDGGGIFLLDLKRRTVTRISDFCYNPAWSPDGKAIACATEPVFRPEQRLGPKSSLWIINVASHHAVQIYAGDAVQPSWSPTGKRIAFWRAGEATGRDVWTIAADGSSPKPVMEDAPLDWCPRWSPDGKWLYFLSDRSGAMNLWRAPVDPSTGDVRGPIEPQTTPAVAMSVFSFAQSAPLMVYENRIIRGRLVRIDLHSGESRTLVDMPAARQPIGPDLSADGKWLTFYTLGTAEEIYVVRSDGSDLRRLVSGEFRNRGPRWSPDGSTIAFQSNKSGRAEIWTIHPDGSGLRQVTSTTGAEPIQPVWSPDGRSLAYSRMDGTSAIIDMTRLGSAEPQSLAANGFFARSWSPDGTWILGQMANADSSLATMVEYDVKSGRTRELGSGNQDIWDPDGRHVIYERDGDVWQLYVDKRKQERLVEVQPNRLAGMRRSPDERYLYEGVATIDSDLWLREPSDR
jgi:eukaryotic-like serine/threonine-protein kinase